MLETRQSFKAATHCRSWPCVLLWHIVGCSGFHTQHICRSLLLWFFHFAQKCILSMQSQLSTHTRDYQTLRVLLQQQQSKFMASTCVVTPFFSLLVWCQHIPPTLLFTATASLPVPHPRTQPTTDSSAEISMTRAVPHSSLHQRVHRFASRSDMNIILDIAMAPFMLMYTVGGFRVLLESECAKLSCADHTCVGQHIPAGYPCDKPALDRSVFLLVRLPASLLQYWRLMHPVTGTHPHELCGMTLLWCYLAMLSVAVVAPKWYVRRGRGWLLVLSTIQITAVSLLTTFTHPHAPISEFWTVSQLSLKGLRLVIQHIVGRVSVLPESGLLEFGVGMVERGFRILSCTAGCS